MKKRNQALRWVLLATALSLGWPVFGREIQTKSDSGTLQLKTLTEYGVDLDDPTRYGLAFSIPELAVTFDLFGYQKVTNRLKSADPVGFIDLTLGEVQIRFTNLAQPDYNNPGQSMGFGFNDSAAGKTGYFGPLYLQNVRSGILWGDWVLQLGAGGTDAFWDPWHREATGYGQLATSWAYLDTRVQYQRPLIPSVIKAPTSESNYWSYDSYAGSMATGVDEVGGNFSGPMVGLQYAGTQFSFMVKGATNHSWTDPAENGVIGGLDVAFTPTSVLKGFRVLGSVVSALNQGADHDLDMLSGGAKVGYDVGLPKFGLKISSIEPYVGLDVQKTLSGDAVSAAEAAAGVTLHWPGMNGWGFDYLQGPVGRTGNVYSGLTLAYKTLVEDLSAPGDLHHSAQLTWYNDADGGLVNNVGSELVAQWKDLASPDQVLMVTGYLDTALPGVLGGTLVPWTKVYYDRSNQFQNAMVHGGLKLRKAIRNAEFGLTYQSRNLLGDPASTSVTDGYGAQGIVKASIQISL